MLISLGWAGYFLRGADYSRISLGGAGFADFLRVGWLFPKGVADYSRISLGGGWLFADFLRVGWLFPKGGLAICGLPKEGLAIC